MAWDRVTNLRLYTEDGGPDLVAPYTDEEISQSIEPISAGSIRRTVNGELLDLTRETHRKFKTTISGSGMRAPAIGGLKLGQRVIVDTVVQLQCAAGDAPPRDPVDTFWTDADGVRLPSPVGAAWANHRIRLICRVTGLSIDRDPYAQRVAWQLQLEEI